MVRTAMERYAVAGWNGPIAQKGQKVSETAQAFLKTLPVENLRNVIEAVEKGCTLLGLNSQGKSKNRSYIKKFFEFCEQQQWLVSIVKVTTSLKPQEVYRFQNPNGQRKIYRISSTGTRNSPTISLGTHHSDYIVLPSPYVETDTYLAIECLTLKCASQVTGIFNFFVFEHRLINQTLWQELEDFAQYINHLSSAEGVIQKVLQMFGYIHRIEGIPIEDLSLSRLVPFIKIHYLNNSFSSRFTLQSLDNSEDSEKDLREVSTQEEIAQRRLRQKAKELINWLNKYLKWLDQCRIEAGEKDGLSNSTKQQFVYALIKIGEYIYQSESLKNFKDIEIINRLREKHSELTPNRRKQKARVAARCLTWDKVIEVIELQRKKADTRQCLQTISKNGTLHFTQRRLKAIASDIQKTIILLLMVLIPTDRQQTYRRIEFRESLKIDEQIDGVFLLWGAVTNNIFTPGIKLENSSEAKWWLAIYDFKTVEKYGPFWYPVPNQEFSDGKTFYEYLEMWFFGLEDLQGKWTAYYKGENIRWQGYLGECGRKGGWREALHPQHNFAFSMPRIGQPFDRGSFKDLVRDTFIQLTPQVDDGKITPVTPHSFRTMLATYTQGKLNHSEEQSMAYCEHHSVELRRGTYTFVDNLRQIADAQRVMEKINTAVFLERIQHKQETSVQSPEESESSPTSSFMSVPGSVWEAMEQYALTCDGNRFSMLRTAIERYAVPGWGGIISKAGQKVNQAAQEFLTSLQTYRIESVLEAIEKGCDLLQLSARGKSRNRSYAKKFLEYCKQQGWLSEPITRKTPPVKDQAGSYRFSQVGKQRSQKASSTGAGKILPYYLGVKPSDYIITEGHRLLGNADLQSEIDSLTDYVHHQARCKELLSKVHQMLGYFHRIRGVPLSDLRLTNLIPFVKIHYAEQDFANDAAFILNDDGTPRYPAKVEHQLSLAERIAKRQILKESKNVLSWLDEYFNWLDQSRIEVGELNGYANGTKLLYIDTLIVVAKYIYCSETDSTIFSDIEIIEKLRAKLSEFPIDRKKQKARVSASCITWEEVIEVVEMQRKKADQRYMLSFPHHLNGKFYPYKRRATGIAQDIQKALILLLMVVIPTDRQQTYRRLQFLETLKVDEKVDGVFLLYGDFNNGVLIPKSKLKNPEQARWWFAVYDFKTDEEYGPFWYPLPNQKFIDGKTLYEYLEMWLFGLEDTEGKWHKYYREENATWQGYIDEHGQRCGWRAALRAEHNYVFSTPTSHNPYSRGGFTQLIKNLFIRFTPELERKTIVPVTPQRFRTMLATYTDGKLSDREEQSMAYCEHHSVTMRRRAYTLSDNMRQIEGAVEVMNQINEKLFLR